MAHAYDTKLVAPQRTTLLNGALQTLAPLAAPTGFLQSLFKFGAVVRSWTDEQGVELLCQAMAGRAPAVAIATGTRRSRPASSDGFRHLSDIELLLYFASNNARDLVAGRLETDDVGAADDTADPGLHVAMELAEQLLVGKRCGGAPTIKLVRPDLEEELTTREDITIWLQTYQVTMTRSIDRHRGLTQRLVGIDTTIRPSDEDKTSPAALPFSTELP